MANGYTFQSEYVFTKMFKLVTRYVFQNEEEVALHYALLDNKNSTIGMEDVDKFESSLKELKKKVNFKSKHFGTLPVFKRNSKINSLFSLSKEIFKKKLVKSKYCTFSC